MRAVAVLALLSLSCAQTPDYTVYIDEHFSPDQRAKIEAALADWSEHTPFRHTDVTFTGDMQAFTVENGTIYIVSQRPPLDAPPAGGYHAGLTIRHETGSVVYLDPHGDSSFFEGIATHELGHAAGLMHYFGTEPSIMIPVLKYGTARSVQPADVAAFCEEWGC